MPNDLLEVRYTIRMNRLEFERMFEPMAGQLADVPGLRWKIWVMDEAKSRGGGIYLFDDEASLNAFVAGPIVEMLRTHPDFTDLSLEIFSVLERLSDLTRGPVWRTDS